MLTPELEARALAMDAADPLRGFRGEFHIPLHAEGEQLYLCGNSLGLQPKATRAAVLDELDAWATLGVEGHFLGKHPWMPYHERARDGLAHLVGAQPGEVVAMNSLTVNLHLLMASFYRPTRERSAIVIEEGAFPSDRHAVAAQIAFHGFDPERDLIEVAPDASGLLPLDRLAEVLAREGQRVALVLWPGVQYRTGETWNLKEVVRLAHAQGARVGFDLAHAVGNLQLGLHDSGVDFAAWCHYKYVNSGPGAVAGAFVHERHARADLPRLAGWWGHDQASRFRMGPEFHATPGAEGWQLSNPPILALAPVCVALEQFQRAGMAEVRRKSVALTAFFEALIHEHLGDVLDIVTPRDAERRGAQLSLRVRAGREAGRALFEHLGRQGIIGDWREPDVIRVAPTALYNRYSDALRLIAGVQGWRAA